MLKKIFCYDFIRTDACNNERLLRNRQRQNGFRLFRQYRA